MSDKFEMPTFGMPVVEVGKSVRQMIKQKYILSSANYNSLYLYAEDEVPVVTLSEYHYDDASDKDEYFLSISNIPETPKLNISRDFYGDVILAIARRGGNPKPLSDKFNIDEVRKFYEDNKHLGEKEAAALLIKYLIDHNCPTDIINRTFYFFDTEKRSIKTYAHDLLGQLNHENRLVRYDTSHKQQWFFVGKNGARSFSPLNSKAQKIFNAVEKAYAKQK